MVLFIIDASIRREAVVSYLILPLFFIPLLFTGILLFKYFVLRGPKT